MKKNKNRKKAISIYKPIVGFARDHDRQRRLFSQDSVLDSACVKESGCQVNRPFAVYSKTQEYHPKIPKKEGIRSKTRLPKSTISQFATGIKLTCSFIVENNV